jgi:hypothetical protein
MDFQNVRITEEEVAELDAGRAIARVPRHTIEAIELRYGSRSERPLLQSVFGFGLIGLGLYPLPGIVEWFLHGGVIHDWTVWLLVNVPLGTWMVWWALRPGYYLWVVAPQGSRKIAFAKIENRMDLDQFLGEANTTLGYNIIVEKQS